MVISLWKVSQGVGCEDRIKAVHLPVMFHEARFRGFVSISLVKALENGDEKRERYGDFMVFLGFYSRFMGFIWESTVDL